MTLRSMKALVHERAASGFGVAAPSDTDVFAAIATLLAQNTLHRRGDVVAYRSVLRGPIIVIGTRSRRSKTSLDDVWQSRHVIVKFVSRAELETSCGYKNSNAYSDDLAHFRSQ